MPAPLFESVVTFQNYPGAQSENNGPLSFAPKQAFERVHFPVALVARPASHSIGFVLTADPRVLDASAARRILARTAQFLAAFAEEPELEVGRLVER